MSKLSTLARALGAGLAVSALLASPAAAQVELGVAAGASTYFGDLSPSRTLDAFSQSQASVGGYARIPVSELFSARVFVQSSQIRGDDALREYAERNLSFRSRIFELGLLAEVYPIGTDRVVAPYLSFGASVYRFNPETNYNGRWVELQPLGTEGQGLPGFAPRYSLTRFAMPVGLGVRYPLGDALVIGADIATRMTFFDHLDDVSGNYVNYYTLLNGRGIQGSGGNGSLSAAVADRTGEYLGTDPRDLPSGRARGNAANNDWFQTATITLGYRIGSGLFSAGGTKKNSSRYNRCYQF